MWALYSDSIVLEEQIFDGYIIIKDEKIREITSQKPEHIKVVDYRGLTVMAGLVDSHVHINEPGRTEWEGFFEKVFT